MTPAQELCNEAGLTVAQAARKVRVQPGYLSKCIRHGCTDGTAEAICYVLDCDPNIFLWGYEHWKKKLRGQIGVARSDTFDEAPAASPAPRPISQAERRRHILELV